MKKKNGFTLIELLAVIVILAIIALIATPMVLKYIKTSKEGSYDNSIDNILRAAENYYAGSLLNSNTTYPQNFMFPNNKELGVKGKQPDSGYLTVYADGSTYLYAVYDDIIYTKLPNEQRATKYTMVIGDDITWITDGKGKITKYNLGSESQKIEYQLELFYAYVANNDGIVSAYATRDSNSYEFDFNLSLKENIEKLEQEENISRKTFPLELNKEIDYLIDLVDSKDQMTTDEYNKLINEHKNNLFYTTDLYTKLTQEGIELSDLKAYQLIKDNLESTDFLVIPNYIKHSDGTKEKITSIDTYAFRDKSINGAFDCYLAPVDIGDKGMDLIISEGIETINDATFQFCLLNSVNIGNTVKTIGYGSFNMNLLRTLVLPDSLETIDVHAFSQNNISGDIVIPRNVVTIKDSAFENMKNICSEDELNGGSGELVVKLCKAMAKASNEISSVMFEKDSKIETIGSNAFKGNKLESVIIPGSIKTIDSNAFDCDTLKSAIIERAKGSDLTVDSTAFGTVTPLYKS